MSERELRVEVLREWFYPVVSLRINGRVVPAPNKAIEKRDELKLGWLKNHAYFQKEKPRVSMDPIVKNNQPGYSVRTEIIYL